MARANSTSEQSGEPLGGRPDDLRAAAPVTPLTSAASPAPSVSPAAGSSSSPSASATTPAGSAELPPAEPQSVSDEREDASAIDTLVTTMPSWLVSLLVHMGVLVMLALTSVTIPTAKVLQELTFGTADKTSEEPDFLDSAEFRATEMSAEPMEATSELVSDMSAALPEINTQIDPVAVTPAPSFNPIDVLNPISGDMLTVGGAAVSDSLQGRSASDRKRLLREGGGTEGSEQAVQNALMWFVNHQNRDGSWSLQPLNGGCGCPDAGTMQNAPIAATALALLPFLGAGHTHLEGTYKEQVRAGLYYLQSRQQANGSWYEPSGRLYSHGLASIVMCEAYAMTKDPKLARSAQAALQFIAYAQDPIGGGWRYEVQEPGDTSVVGWQLMALKSGHMGQLQIMPITLERTVKFLDSVQSDSGAAYGYQRPGAENNSATTAIGLLCRMYLGWKHEEPALVRGIERLGKRGPSDKDMYYNYYATQVMRHYGGEPWEKWNNEMRDWLVKSQAKKGHQAGSWHVGDSHAAASGGRLYSTAMATMILEVYYRHLPIYQEVAAEDFEL